MICVFSSTVSSTVSSAGENRIRITLINTMAYSLIYVPAVPTITACWNFVDFLLLAYYYSKARLEPRRLSVG